MAAYALATSIPGIEPMGTLLKLGPLGIEPFGLIVAIGVLIGAHYLRKYAEWHGIHDDHIRGLTMWVMVSGFIGAHVFDAVMYNWDKLVSDPVMIFKLWEGISSYGGFIGGAIGFFLYVWWKRLPGLLYADTTIVGLLIAFTIGRIACTVVLDHPGGHTDFFLGMEYKARGKIHNLGFYEFLYLVPVNAIVLFLAFRKSRRLPAGFLAVLTAALYAPVRFFLDNLRPATSDPRHLGLTFAQWASMLVFGAAVIAAVRVFKHGRPAPVGDAAVARPDTAAALKAAMQEPETPKAKPSV